MLSKNNKKKLFVTLFSLAVFFLIASIVCIIIPKEYIKSGETYMFLVIAAVFFVGGLVFLILFLADKKIDNKSIKIQSIIKYIPTNYDKFVDWWSDCDEDEIQQNPLLLGAYRVMWLYSEIMNGGYSQFFCNKEDEWDMDETTELFKSFLPSDLYEHFVAAKSAYYNDESTEEFDRTFYRGYDKKMEKFLNELADKVVSIWQL